MPRVSLQSGRVVRRAGVDVSSPAPARVTEPVARIFRASYAPAIETGEILGPARQLAADEIVVGGVSAWWPPENESDRFTRETVAGARDPRNRHLSPTSPRGAPSSSAVWVVDSSWVIFVS